LDSHSTSTRRDPVTFIEVKEEGKKERGGLFSSYLNLFDSKKGRSVLGENIIKKEKGTGVDLFPLSRNKRLTAERIEGIE